MPLFGHDALSYFVQLSSMEFWSYGASTLDTLHLNVFLRIFCGNLVLKWASYYYGDLLCIEALASNFLYITGLGMAGICFVAWEESVSYVSIKPSLSMCESMTFGIDLICALRMSPDKTSLGHQLRLSSSKLNQHLLLINTSATHLESNLINSPGLLSSVMFSRFLRDKIDPTH